MDTHPFLEQLSQVAISNHKTQKTILSFSDYLTELLGAPHTHIRNANEYARDGFLYLQKHDQLEDLTDFFSTSHDDDEISPIYGHQRVIKEMIQAIDANFREGVPQRLILLHGPNGSGKSSIIKKFMQALEVYSQTNDGALYTFNWIFPLQKINQKQMGLADEREAVPMDSTSFAHLPSEMIQSTIRTEIREAPYLLIPKSYRKQFWEMMIEKCPDAAALTKVEQFKNYFMNGELSLRNQQILDALLKDCEGDLLKVFRHIQVERFFLSREKLTGLVTVEPMMQTDMGLRQLTMEQSFQMLPSTLKSMNLYAMEGEIVQGNRGVIEYNDLLKRPIDSFKYLLTTCETGRVKVGPTSLHLDSNLIGSCNDKQMDAFKEYPDFASFKARFYLIRVPLLLNYLDEAKIYRPLIQQLSGNKPFTPHVDKLIALWAIMTRLKKPLPQNIPEKYKVDLSRMNCLQKAYLYTEEWGKLNFTHMDPKQLLYLKEALLDQHRNVQSFEGRIGASPREMKNIILCATKKYQGHQTVTLKAIIEELQELTERTSEFEFLRSEPLDGYQNPRLFIQTIQDVAIELIEDAFKAATEIYLPEQIENYVEQYIFQVTHLLRGEKIRNSATGILENPDETWVTEFEKRLGISTPDSFRERVLNTIAASYIDTNQKPDIHGLFPDMIRKISKSFYEDKKPQMLRILNHILEPRSKDIPSKERDMAESARNKLIEIHGYRQECLDEALGWLVKKYRS